MMRARIGGACAAGFIFILSAAGPCSLPAQGSNGDCSDAEAALYLATPGAEQGTLEVTQDLTQARALEGEKRLAT